MNVEVDLLSEERGRQAIAAANLVWGCPPGEMSTLVWIRLAPPHPVDPLVRKVIIVLSPQATPGLWAHGVAMGDTVHLHRAFNKNNYL
jgi:hypothetical protein